MCDASLILKCVLQVWQKVESSGLDFKKLDKQMKQKTCWQDFIISSFLSSFSHMPQTQRGRGGFVSVVKSLKVKFLGKKSGRVIFFKVSKADWV